MSNQKSAYTYALLAVLLWSTVATAFKLALQHLDVLQLLTYAVGVSALVLSGMVVTQGKLSRLRRYTWRDYLRPALLGLLNPLAYYLLLLHAYNRLPAQEAQPLNYTWPVVLALLSIPLLGQRVSRTSLAALLVSYGGVLIIATRGEPFSLRFADLPGVLLALGSAGIWALYWILHLRSRRDEMVRLMLAFLFGFTYVAIAAALFSDVPWSVPAGGLLGAAYIGLAEMGVTFVLWQRALQLSDTTARVSAMIYISPFLSLFWIALVVGETIRPSTILGFLLIVVGVGIQHAGGRRARQAVSGG
ncbi:MAG: DMT family transporter [Acidobacteria bacterium]|nr:DMT family transporter [Acidobacteriota bacterium]